MVDTERLVEWEGRGLRQNLRWARRRRREVDGAVYVRFRRLPLPPSDAGYYLWRVGDAREHLAGAPTRLHLAHEDLCLVDGHVGIGHHRGELVGDGAGDDAPVSPVKRHPHLVHRPAHDLEWLEPAGDQCLALDRTSRGRDRHPPGVLDAALAGELG